MSENPPSGDEGLSDAVDSVLRALARPVGSAAPIRVLEPGTAVGRFEVVRFLARGGFGAVYEARDTELGRRVALKLLEVREQARFGAPELVSLFRTEAATVAGLAHPNIVTLFDYGVFEGTPFLVLELLRGATLRDRLGHGPLPAPESVELASQIAAGLAHAHAAGVVHRDLKPSNVFVCEDGRVKLLDFGLALAVAGVPGSPDSLARAGTAPYMAPERRRGAVSDHRGDLYSAGVVLAELLTGRRPEPAGAEEALAAASCPAPLAEVVKRALAVDPASRFQSAEELRNALRSVQATLWAAAPETDAPYRYLEHFTEADAGWFFGRQAETAELARLVESHALVAVVGPSGAGKSSLVRAGLVPRLRSAGHLVLMLRPGPSPFERLADALLRAGARHAPGARELAEKPGLLGRTLRELAAERGRKVVVVVDQAEELFTALDDPQVRGAFAAALLAAADDADGPVRALLTVRGDSLGRLAELRGLGRALGASSLFLGRPDRASLADALEAPARRLGFELEAGLSEVVVAALERETAPLPLLQLAASRLWERRDVAGRRVPRAALEAQGGVSGVIASHAEEVFQRLSTGREAELARELLCALTTVEGTRRTLRLSDLCARTREPAAAERVVEVLVGGRLLTSSRDEGGEWVELSHESLAREWGRLRAWLDEGRDLRRFAVRLAEAAALWNERGEAAELVWSGKTLEEAVALAGALEPLLAPRERRFLAACQVRHRRARRRRRAIFAGAVSGAASLILALVLGLHASRQSAHAARQAAILAAASGARDPLQAALLLQELDPERPPPRTSEVAYRVAREPLPRAVLRGHAALVSSVDVSADGARVVSGSFDGTARIWAGDGRGAPVLLRTRDEVMRVRFSPDGRRVAVASRDRRVYVADVERPAAAAALAGHTAFVLALAFSHDGRHLVSGSSDATVRTWRVGTGTAPRVGRHEGPVWSVDVGPDGRVATGSEDRTVRLWHVEGDAPPVVLRGHEAAVRAVAFRADGTLVASASDDGTARIWPVDGSAPPLVLRGHGKRLLDVAWSPDGALVATASLDKTARLWDAGGGAVAVLHGHDEQVTRVLFSPDGKWLLTASDDRTARVWSVARRELDRVLRGHEQPVAGIAWSKDGKTIVTGAEDGTVRVWPAELETDVRRSPVETVLYFGFSPDGRFLAEPSARGEVYVWPTDGKGAPVVLLGHTGRAQQVAWSPEGARLVSTSYDRTARIWRRDGTAAPILLQGHEGPVFWSAFNPEGRLVLTAAYDRTVRIHSAGGEGEARVLTLGANPTLAAFGAGGRLVAASAVDGTLTVHTVDDGRTASARAHAGLFELAVSPDGARIVTFGMDGDVKLWRATLPLGEPALLWRHEGRVGRAAFSGDGSRVVIGLDDGTAVVLPASGGGPVVTLRGHRGQVRQALFHPDDRRVLTSSMDGTLRVWDAGSGEEELSVEIGGFVDYIQVSADGRYAAVRNDWGVRHLVRLRRWPELARRLRSASSACLPAADRRRHLGEGEQAAAAAFARCERAHGRSGE